MALSVKHNTLTSEAGGLIGATHWDESHELTAATSKILGTNSSSTTVREITLGTNLSLSGDTLNASGGSGGIASGKVLALSLGYALP
jgi:hypothetical protein